MAKRKKSVKKSAKKKAKRSKVTATKEPKQEVSQFALRLNSKLYEEMKRKAEQASISVNQLIQGICEAAMANIYIGEPIKDGDAVRPRGQAGCVYFGEFNESVYEHKGRRISGSKLQDNLGGIDPETEAMRDPEIEFVGRKGTIWFGLDYSGRGYRKY